MKRTDINLLLKIILLLFGGGTSLVAYAGPDGKQLYEFHCSACHGEDGRGGVGVPLALPGFLNTVPDQYLHKTIRFGRPGRVMPPFKTLTNSEISAIVQLIRSWSPGAAVTYPDNPVHGNKRKGATLYAKNCAGCHGSKGEGGQGTGVTYSRPRDLPIIAPALSNSGFLASANDQMIKSTLMKGRKGTPMPSFLEQGLSEKDIDDIVSYVRSFETVAKSSQNRLEPPMSPILSYESSYDFEETVENLKQAAIGANFRIIREQHLNAGITKPEHEDKQKMIIYFCNFNTLNQALAIDSRVGLFLPCRVTVVKHKDKVMVMSINPKLLSTFFNNRELDQLCQEMYETYRAILEEATL